MAVSLSVFEAAASLVEFLIDANMCYFIISFGIVISHIYKLKFRYLINYICLISLFYYY